jgi:hypothetical protein
MRQRMVDLILRHTIVAFRQRTVGVREPMDVDMIIFGDHGVESCRGLHPVGRGPRLRGAGTPARTAESDLVDHSERAQSDPRSCVDVGVLSLGTAQLRTVGGDDHELPGLRGEASESGSGTVRTC